MSRDAGAQFLVDTLTQYQLGGADSTHSLLLAPSNFFTFRHRCQIPNARSDFLLVHTEITYCIQLHILYLVIPKIIIIKNSKCFQAEHIYFTPFSLKWCRRIIGFFFRIFLWIFIFVFFSIFAYNVVIIKNFHSSRRNMGPL